MKTVLSNQDYGVIRNLIKDRAAIVLEESKNYLIDSRLNLLKERKQYKDLSEIVDKIKYGKCEESIQEVINVMTTNETSFFRDTHPFDTLKNKIIPEILKQNRQDKFFTIWCGACSTGQEPYSLAMLLAENFPQLLAEYSVKILATDISTEVLKQAATGKYTQIEVNRGLPIQLLLKYFNRDGQLWQVKDQIRALIDFKPFNLSGSWQAIPPIDLAFLRNVMIYFDEKTRIQILNNLQTKLKKNGCLFVGGGEMIPAANTAYKRQNLAGSYYYICE